MKDILAMINDIPSMIIALEAALVALIALFVLIPGKQPEAALQKVVDLIKKLSRK